MSHEMKALLAEEGGNDAAWRARVLVALGDTLAADLRDRAGQRARELAARGVRAQREAARLHERAHLGGRGPARRQAARLKMVLATQVR